MSSSTKNVIGRKTKTMSQGVMIFSNPVERLSFDLRDLEICLENARKMIENQKVDIEQTAAEMKIGEEHVLGLIKEIAEIKEAIAILQAVKK